VGRCPCSSTRSASSLQSRRRCIRVRLVARRSSRSDRDHGIIRSTPPTVLEFRYRCRDRILVCPGLGNQPSWPDLGRRAVPEADPLATIERAQPSRYPAASPSPQADPYRDGRVPMPAPGATAAGAARLRRVALKAAPNRLMCARDRNGGRLRRNENIRRAYRRPGSTSLSVITPALGSCANSRRYGRQADPLLDLIYGDRRGDLRAACTAGWHPNLHDHRVL
jgi:hypothetical protein